MHCIVIFGILHTLRMTKLRLTAYEKRNKVLFKGCHFKLCEKIDILSRVKSLLGASQCKQVGVSHVQTRKCHCDWSSFRLQAGAPSPGGVQWQAVLMLASLS